MQYSMMIIHKHRELDRLLVKCQEPLLHVISLPLSLFCQSNLIKGEMLREKKPKTIQTYMESVFIMLAFFSF